MNEKELRELDCWIADNVFGLPVQWDQAHGDYPQYLWFRKHQDCAGRGCAACRNTGNECEKVNYYTTDHAAAMLVLEKCISQCRGSLEITRVSNGSFRISEEGNGHVWGDTLHVSIALFAKQLFTK